ncbi:hypothetical protein GQ44DRAFT_732337 [Phaeosphaeriaceae sp. PMI808]|nr:hypothetical protein GQ44DRAFT_732337 [Phaeosphaeriaceae sp. PMI808]
MSRLFNFYQTRSATSLGSLVLRAMTITSVFWLGICTLSRLVYTQDVRKIIFYESEDFAGANYTYEVDISEKACMYTSGQQVPALAEKSHTDLFDARGLWNGENCKGTSIVVYQSTKHVRFRIEGREPPVNTFTCWKYVLDERLKQLLDKLEAFDSS